MRRLLSVACAGALAVVASAAGCADLDPVEVEVQLPAGDGGSNPACLACARGEVPNATSCQEPRQICDDDDKCRVAVECQLERGCYELDVDELINCSIPCGIEAGLTSFDDPALQLLVDWSNCAIPACYEVCGWDPSNIPGADGGVVND